MTEKLKKEVQKFLTKKLRPQITKEIKTKYAKKIQKKYSKQKVKKNFSNVLRETIKDDTDIFNSINRKIKNNWLNDFIKMKDDLKKDYPLLTDKYNKYKLKHGILVRDKKIILPEKNIKLIFEYFGDTISYAQMSQIQSGKAKAGKSFESCISICLEACDIQFQEQITKKSIDESNTDIKKTDLIFPSMQYALSNPRDSFQAECQSTLADRFRLTVGKVTDIPMNCLTADGTDFYGNKDTISESMNEEAKKAKITIVAFKDVAIKKKNLGYTQVISYEEFINEIDGKSKKWKKE